MDAEQARDEIIERIEIHKQDGFNVDAIRVPPEYYNAILRDASFQPSRSTDEHYFMGLELILDPSISAPVADDVELVE